MKEKEHSDHEAFLRSNRIRINCHFNIVLWFCVLTGPAIALGILAGIFREISYATCFIISAVMALLALVHYLLLKRYPQSLETAFLALTALNVLIVYMDIAHVEIHLTWFLVPLLSLLYSNRGIYLYAVISNYLLMGVATWISAPWHAAQNARYASPEECFFNLMGGFTIETVIMLAAGHRLGTTAVSYLRELTEKFRQASLHDQRMEERMRILDSMAEIYDNVNLIDFLKSTETSLRDENLTEYVIHMPEQDHTRMTQKLRNFIMPDQLEEFWKFTNITTVRARLTHKKIISGDFIHSGYGWFRAQYITVDATKDGIPNSVIFTTRNIDEEKRREEHLVRISMTDELTRLYNRRCYEEDIDRLRKQGLGEDFVLFSIDVNGLKIANDTLGHAAGDELIKGAADCLSAAVGTRGKAYRTGGDEFLAIAHTDDPENILELIRKKTAEWHGVYLDHIALAAGYAAFRDHKGDGIDDLERLADARMYEAKERYYQEKGLHHPLHRA